MWAGWRYEPTLPSTLRLWRVLFKASPRALVRPSIARMAIAMRKEWRLLPRRERRGLRAELLMGKIVVTNNVTLDGVMQAPARPDEDTRGGFAHGGWAIPYNDAVMASVMAERMAQGT